LLSWSKMISMALTFLIIITLLAVVWALWIRRITWTCRWEVAATLNIALQGLAVALMSPLASRTLGVALHHLTGEWNIEDWLAHDCYIVAASAICCNTVGRLTSEHEMQRHFKLAVEVPATLCIPLLLATFTMSHASKVYQDDFFAAPTDGWLTLYWVILCGTLAWLLGYSARALTILHADPRSRSIATVYMFAVGAGLLACVIRIIEAFFPALQGVQGALAVWFPACMCGGVFALASAHSWRQKLTWFGADRKLTEVEALVRSTEPGRADS
jgi:hypothetical protein